MSLTGPEVGRARVLVTGADGFVGRRLTAAMAERRPNWIVTAAGGPQGPGGLDVVDPDAVTAMVERARPDVVVHL
ncbi:MAG: NAD-dependent epimerase/dehydratase family protein, partial [Caulobacteraceae bacterium]